MIRCIILEDQAPAQRILQKYIRDIGDLRLEETFSDPINALEYLKTNPVDLIFLDIHLPKLSGMDFLKVLDKKPMVILTTAFHEYAVQSYEFDVLDYLLKPISYERFCLAIEKAKNGFNQEKSKSKDESSILVKVGYDYVSVNTNDILYIQTDGDYTRLFLDGKNYLVGLPLRYWNEHLPADKFCQIHRFYTVAVGKIDKITSNSVVISHIEIPVGRKYKYKLKEYVMARTNLS